MCDAAGLHACPLVFHVVFHALYPAYERLAGKFCSCAVIIMPMPECLNFNCDLLIDCYQKALEDLSHSDTRAHTGHE